MASEPWFKFYAADYLLDADVDSLPLEAQAVLLRMWCLCHLERFCPVSPEEIARKTRLSIEVIAKYHGQLTRFFDLRDGGLYSSRMEKERSKSAAARESANRRWHRSDAERNANRNAEGDAQSQSQSQSQDQNLPPLKESVLFHSKEKGFSQFDFDARDLRKLAKAREELTLKLSNGWGSNLTADEIWEHQCILAGISAQQAHDVLERTKKRPQVVGASA